MSRENKRRIKNKQFKIHQAQAEQKYSVKANTIHEKLKASGTAAREVTLTNIYHHGLNQNVRCRLKFNQPTCKRFATK